MNLVDSCRKLSYLLQKMATNSCYGCVLLEKHIELLREEESHKEEVKALKYQMSDEALQHMPDFQGRVYSISLLHW